MADVKLARTRAPVKGLSSRHRSKLPPAVLSRLQAIRELHDVRERLISARHTAATIVLALPQAETNRHFVEIAHTVYDCIVVVLDKQVAHLETFAARALP